MIATRIKKVREISGWKQAAVASSLNISQQAYGSFENNGNSAKLETLRKFCDVMNINLSFLLESEIPITEESLRTYGRTGFGEVTLAYAAMKRKVEVFQDLLTRQGC